MSGRSTHWPGEWTEPLTVFWDTRAPTVQISSSRWHRASVGLMPATERIGDLWRTTSRWRPSREIRDEGDALVRSIVRLRMATVQWRSLSGTVVTTTATCFADGIYRASLTRHRCRATSDSDPRARCRLAGAGPDRHPCSRR